MSWYGVVRGVRCSIPGAVVNRGCGIGDHVSVAFMPSHAIAVDKTVTPAMPTPVQRLG